MLTANLPFQGESEFHIMTAHVNAQPPSPTVHYPYIPKGIENAVMKALAKDPDARFQTVEEFGAALETAGLRRDHAIHCRDAAASTAVRSAAARDSSADAAPGRQATRGTHTGAAYFRLSCQSAAGPAGRTANACAGPDGQHAASASPRTDTDPGGEAVATQSAARHHARQDHCRGRGCCCFWALLRSANREGNRVKIPERPPSTSENPPAVQRTDQEVTVWPPAPSTGGGDSGSTDLKVVQFSANARRVAAGQRARLNWSVRGASQVTITPSIGTVEAAGSKDIVVERTTEFVLVARKVDGTEVRETTVVEVTPAETPKPPPAPPPTPKPAALEVSIGAQPESITSGQTAVLRWSVPGATQ